MAYRHRRDTGGEVTGYFGLAACTTVPSEDSELPSKGLCSCCQRRSTGLRSGDRQPCCKCTRRRAHPRTTSRHGRRSPGRRKPRVPSRLVCPTCWSGPFQEQYPMRHSGSKTVSACFGALAGPEKHTKSVRCTWPSASRSTLSGFTSRWMMPWPCT